MTGAWDVIGCWMFQIEGGAMKMRFMAVVFFLLFSFSSVGMEEPSMGGVLDEITSFCMAQSGATRKQCVTKLSWLLGNGRFAGKTSPEANFLRNLVDTLRKSLSQENAIEIILKGLRRVAIDLTMMDESRYYFLPHQNHAWDEGLDDSDGNYSSQLWSV